MQTIIAWISTAAVFGAADFIWLSLMTPRLYRPAIGALMAEQPSLPAAAAFYVIYISGLVFFAVSPALERESLGRAILHGAALGFVAYATYDLSNQATLKIWDLKLTLIDLAWGTFASALAAGAAYWVAHKFG